MSDRHLSHDIRVFIKALNTEKEQYRQVIDGALDQGLEMGQYESTGELSSYDNHPADSGSETFEREREAGAVERAERLLDKIERAFKRIEEGTYTTCEACGGKIDEKRLLALPYVSECVECADEHEREAGDAVSEQAYVPSAVDGTYEPGYDDDDVWEELAAHGTANTLQDAEAEVDGKLDTSEEGLSD